MCSAIFNLVNVCAIFVMDVIVLFIFSAVFRRKQYMRELYFLKKSFWINWGMNGNV